MTSCPSLRGISPAGTPGTHQHAHLAEEETEAKGCSMLGAPHLDRRKGAEPKLYFPSTWHVKGVSWVVGGLD